MLLKACLGSLQAQNSKPQGLSTLLGQKKKKAHLMKHALGMHFWCFLKKHKAGLGALFYFTAKKDMNHQN